MKASHVLAGDVGGTRARLALFDAKRPKRAVYSNVLESQRAKRFEDVIAAFLEQAKAEGHAVGTIASASFGIAGPVVDQRVKTTNLPWLIDARAVAKRFRIPTVTLLNDLVAVGLGALDASPAKLAPIHLGRPKKTGGNVAVIAAGTGLGEAAFVWDGARHVPCATEGSHVDFAPRTALEIELLATLADVHGGHVSYERVASGSTIHVLYEFFVRERRVIEPRANAARVAEAKDANVAIVELAESGASEAAMDAIDLWASVYGAETGNLALKCLASAGVFVCGGASARLAKVLARGLPKRKATGPSPFVAAFLDKGRMRRVLEAIPVAVCLEPFAGLQGAAAHAFQGLKRRL